MKKALVLILTLALLLTTLASLVSCGNDATPEDTTDATAGSTATDDPAIRIGFLSGSTGLGLSKLIADNEQSGNDFYIRFNSPVEIMSAFANGSIDLAALPTNAFPNYANQMKGNREIQMIALNTLGVLYLLTDDGTTVSPADLSSLSGKTVYVPEQAPKLILQHILQKSGVENVTLDMTYDLETLPAAAQTDSNVHYILFPEPKVTVLLNTQGNKTYSIALDLTEAWANVEDDQLVQGCMFASKSFIEEHPAAIAGFLADYERSINFMKDPANLDAAAQYAVNAGIFPKLPIAKQAIPRCNLTFITGDDMANTANAFFTALGIAEQPISAFYGITDDNLD